MKPQLGLSELAFDNYHICEGQFGSNKIYLVLSDRLSVDANGLDVELRNTIGEFDALIFLSKHASVSGIPTFCLHTQGNWGSAKLGGSPQTLGVTPVVLKNLLYQQMVTQNTTNFDVVHEGTHHGPDLEIPTIFYEIGSTEKEWSNPVYAQFMVSVFFDVLEQYDGEQSSLPVILGIGGSHTCSNFNRLSAEGKILVGHVAPNYAVNSLTVEMVRQAITKTTLPSQIVVDWKALNSEMRHFVSNVLCKSNISFEKLKSLKKRLD